MKKVLRYTFSILLTAVILTSSSGLFLCKMVCGISGNSIISLTPLEKCQDTEKTGITSNCCDFSHLLLKMKIDASDKQLNLQAGFHFIPLTYVATTDLFELYNDQAPVFAFTDLPPPKPVATFLALMQVYLI